VLKEYLNQKIVYSSSKLKPPKYIEIKTLSSYINSTISQLCRSKLYSEHGEFGSIRIARN
jgi:hypothetical protein